MNQGQASGVDRSGPAWAHYLLVGAVGGVIVLWNLGGGAMEDHECKLALVARVMADRDHSEWLAEGLDENGQAYPVVEHSTLNHWMVPVENGRPRLVKTPLPYWCAAWIARAGGGVNEWTARAGSAICAVLLAWVTLALGRRMLSPRAALLGALMLATTVGFQKWGRDARPEMMLCLFMTLAMACFYFATESRTRAGRVAWMAAFWAAMGLGNLTKEFVPILLLWPLAGYVFWRRSAETGGDEAALRTLRWFLIVTGVGLAVHVAVTLVPALQWWNVLGVSGGKGSYLTMAVAIGAPMLWYFLRTRGWGPAARLLPTAVPGAAVMLAMFLPWMGYMHHLFPDLAGGVFSSQVGERAAGTGGWTVELPTKYALALLSLSLPWLGFLPGAFAVGLMRRFAERRRGLVFLLLWCVGLLVLFSAAAAKREHYILPMIPALCLLMGFVAEDVFRRHAWIQPHLARVLGGSYGLVGIVGVIGMAAAWVIHLLTRRPEVGVWNPEDMKWPLLLAVVAAAAVPISIAGWLAWKRRFGAVMPLTLLAIAMVYVGYWQVFPRFDPRRVPADFARDAAAIIPHDEEAFHWGDPQAKTVFYFGRPIPAVQWKALRPARFRGAAYIRDASPEQIDAWTAAWLKAEPIAWIFGYQAVKGRPTKEAELLRELGYRPVPGMTRQGVQEKRHLFTLWHKEPGASAPASNPSTAR